MFFQPTDKFYLFIFLGWEKRVLFESYHLQQEMDSSMQEYTACLQSYLLQTA